MAKEGHEQVPEDGSHSVRCFPAQFGLRAPHPSHPKDHRNAARVNGALLGPKTSKPGLSILQRPPGGAEPGAHDGAKHMA